MKKPYDAALEAVDHIVIVHAGSDVVWARWLLQTAEDAGVRVETFVVRARESLLSRIEELAGSGTVVVPVVTPHLVGTRVATRCGCCR